MDTELKAIIKDAAKRLTGYKRREYQAEITRKYFDGRPWKTEREIGGGENAFRKALTDSSCNLNHLTDGIKKQIDICRVMNISFNNK